MQYIILIVFIVLFSGCSYNNESVEKQITSLETLKSFIEDGQKNGYFPKEIVTGMPISPNKLQPVDIENSTIITWDMKSECVSSGKKVVLALDDKNHSIVCNNGDVAYITGNGNDLIDDAVGNDIFYSGEGDDTIENSWGSDIFIFEKNWGHDIIEFEPNVIDTSKIIGYDGSYPWKYSSFIIFGKQINHSDIYWEGNTLVHSKTGDSIKLNSKEINIIYANEDNSKLTDTNFISTKKVPKKISIEQIKGQSLTIKDNIAYIADKGLLILDVKDINNTTILSETYHLPGIATSVNIVGNIAYVTHAAPYFSEGAGGWVSIIDISDPQNPKILKTLNFGNNIFNITINGKYLYVADTNFSYRDKRYLYIYDISTPSKPKLLSKTKLQHYSRFMTYSDGLLFLSTFRSWIALIDVRVPEQPKVFLPNHPLDFKKQIYSIKAYEDKIIVNQAENAMSILNITNNQKISHLCDIQTDGKWSTNSASSFTINNNFIYRAQSDNIVSMIDMKSCELKQNITFNNIEISSVGVTNNNILIGMSKETAATYDLTDLEIQNANTDTSEISPKNQLQKMLYQAAHDNERDDVIRLCKAGANPNFAGDEKYTPVQISSSRGTIKALRALLRNGGVVDGKSMMLAAMYNQQDIMKLLEKSGGNIAQTDNDGCTTLHYIAKGGRLEMVKYLVEKGVPVNATCKGNETALTWANYGKNIEVIQYLESIEAK